MAANRENQGLQIALILFVIVTVALAVSCYFFYAKAQEKIQLAAAMQADKERAETTSLKAISQNNQLKKFMGYDEETDYETIAANFDKDMHAFPDGYEPETMDYRTLPQVLLDEIVKTDAARIAAEKRAQLAEAEKSQIRAQEQALVVKVRDDFANVVEENKGVRTRYVTDTTRVEEEKTRMASQLRAAQQEVTKLAEKSKDEVQQLQQELQKQSQIAESFKNQVKQQSTDTFARPQGEVTRVNKGANVVWINLGSGDGLNRQTSFSVHPAGTEDVGDSGGKASIEVTRILNDRLAEARIVNDEITNPIMVGDVIYSPAWEPGGETAFALAGFMDIDDDGNSDRNKVKSLILRSGGNIVAEVDDEGRRTGKIDINTRYLVVGDAPTEKSSKEAMASYSSIQKEASSLGIELISVDKFLNLMGYDRRAHSVRLDRAARSEDFKARPAGGVLKSSDGNVSDAFKKREPGGRSAY